MPGALTGLLGAYALACGGEPGPDGLTPAERLLYGGLFLTAGAARALRGRHTPVAPG